MSCTAVVNYTTPVGTDNCPGVMTTQTLGLASGASYPIGVTTNTFLVTATNGATNTCSFTVTVVDNQPPTIICPGNITANASVGLCSRVVTYTAPVGTSPCPGANTIQTSGFTSGSPFPVGITTNTFQVTGSGRSTYLGWNCCGITLI